MAAELVFEGGFLGGGLVFFVTVFGDVFFPDDCGFVLLLLGISVKLGQQNSIRLARQLVAHAPAHALLFLL